MTTATTFVIGTSENCCSVRRQAICERAALKRTATELNGVADKAMHNFQRFYK